MQSGLYTGLYYQGGADVYHNRWQKPGDITNQPKMRWSSSRTLTGSEHSTLHLYDGDFVRLRDLTLNYNFSSDLISEIGLDRLSVYVKGTNVWTWTKDDLQLNLKLVFQVDNTIFGHQYQKLYCPLERLTSGSN